MEKQCWRIIAAAGWIYLLLVAVALVLPANAQEFTELTAPENLGSPISTEFGEAGPFISKDGLSLFFNSNRPVPGSNCPGGLAGIDIYVSQRAAVDDPWGEPVNLGPNINSCFDDQTSVLSPDEHRLYFASNRPGGFGGIDLYVSSRQERRDDFGWRPPKNLDGNVNTLGGQFGPSLFEDDVTGITILYFSSNPTGVAGTSDIYASALDVDGSFLPAVLVAELSTPCPPTPVGCNDIFPGIRRDGLEIFLVSNRSGGLGLLDIWSSTRASTSDPWSTPVNRTVVNSTADDFRPVLSFDGRSLYFGSNRLGGFGGNDIYVSTREKLPELE